MPFFKVTNLHFIALAFSLALFCSCADDLKAIEWTGTTQAVSSSSSDYVQQQISSSSLGVQHISSSSDVNQISSSSSSPNQIQVSSSSVGVPSLSGTCNLNMASAGGELAKTNKMLLVNGGSIVAFTGVSINNRTSDCEALYFSLDNGETSWQSNPMTIPAWKADSMLIAGKIYAKCGETLLSPIDCPSIKIKNPQTNIESQKVSYFVDARDEQIYQTITIGSKTWMSENLNYAVPDGNSKCHNDSTAYCNKYGRLYNWQTASTTACPSGWSLPTDPDLTNLVGTNNGDIYRDLAIKLVPCNENICNSTGFTALSIADNFASWWSLIKNNTTTTARVLEIDVSLPIEGLARSGRIYESDITNLHSVRCVKAGS